MCDPLSSKVGVRPIRLPTRSSKCAVRSDRPFIERVFLHIGILISSLGSGADLVVQFVVLLAEFIFAERSILTAHLTY